MQMPIRFGAFLAAGALLAAVAAASADKTSTERGMKGSDSLRTALEGRAAAIFKKSCAAAGCHGGARPMAALSLEPKAMAAALRNVPSRMVDTLLLVDTARPERSYLLAKIRGTKGIVGSRMPIHRAPLTAAEEAAIVRWIEALSAEAKESEKKPGGAPKK